HGTPASRPGRRWRMNAQIEKGGEHPITGSAAECLSIPQLEAYDAGGLQKWRAHVEGLKGCPACKKRLQVLRKQKDVMRIAEVNLPLLAATEEEWRTVPATVASQDGTPGEDAIVRLGHCALNGREMLLIIEIAGAYAVAPAESSQSRAQRLPVKTVEL